MEHTCGDTVSLMFGFYSYKTFLLQASILCQLGTHRKIHRHRLVFPTGQSNYSQDSVVSVKP
jgi:hypothetical protein